MLTPMWGFVCLLLRRHVKKIKLCYSVEMIWHLVEAINLIDFRLNEDAFVVFSYKVIVLKWFGISRKLNIHNSRSLTVDLTAVV